MKLAYSFVPLLLLIGCAVDEPPDPDRDDISEAEEELSLASRVHFNFIARANEAAWSNGSAPLAFGTNGPDGTCAVGDVTLEDASQAQALLVSPQRVVQGVVQGAYQVTIPSKVRRPRFVGTVGFVRSGERGGDGVKFEVRVVVDGVSQVLASKIEKRNGELANFSVNLSPFAGRTVTLVLATFARENATGDTAAWTRARITTNSLRYFAPYDSAGDPVLASYSNLLWLSWCNPDSTPAGLAKCEERLSAGYAKLRANPSLSLIVYGGNLWGNDLNHSFPTVRAYLDQFLPTIPADIAPRIAAVALADEPFLRREARAAEIERKLAKLGEYIHTRLPQAATYVNFSFIELDKGMPFPAHMDWAGFDCYSWMESCGNPVTVEAYLGKLAARTNANQGLVLIPQAHRHKANDDLGKIASMLEVYYQLARNHNRVVAILPFSMANYEGVLGYGGADAASQQIREKVMEIGKRVITQ